MTVEDGVAESRRLHAEAERQIARATAELERLRGEMVRMAVLRAGQVNDTDDPLDQLKALVAHHREMAFFHGQGAKFGEQAVAQAEKARTFPTPPATVDP